MTYYSCPARFQAEMTAWINEGELPKSAFLQTVLRGGLKRAIRRGRTDELDQMPRLLMWLERTYPDCWGSDNHVAEWLHAGGAKGRRQVEEEYARALLNTKKEHKDE